MKNKKRMPTLGTITKDSIGSPSHNLGKRKKTSKLERKCKIIFSGDRILYIENPEDFRRKLLELINELDKVAGYKSNIQKSVVSIHK